MIFMIFVARYGSYIDVLFEKKWTPYEKIHFWIDSKTFFIITQKHITSLQTYLELI